MRINGGYFVLRQGIFDYLHEGEDLVMDACVRAAADGKMRAVPYDGFWAPMDTLKERTRARGAVPPRGSAPGRCGGRAGLPGREISSVEMPATASPLSRLG